MQEFKKITSSGISDKEDFAKKCNVWNGVWSQN